jgi:hypothetical protein
VVALDAGELEMRLVREIDRPAPGLYPLGRFERVFFFAETTVFVLAGENLDPTQQDNAHND